MSIPLAESLLRDLKLTLVRTLYKNMQQIPAHFVNTNIHSPTTSMVAFRENTTLLSYYQKKKSRVVSLDNAQHGQNRSIIWWRQQAIHTHCLRLVELQTKDGVEVVDEYKARYSVPRHSNCWPLSLFFSLLNNASMNNFVVYKQQKGDFNVIRWNYHIDIAYGLSRPYLMECHGQQGLRRQIKSNIHQMLELEELRAPEIAEGPRRCSLCDWQKHRTSKTKCHIFNICICKEHTITPCMKATNGDRSNDDYI